MGPGTGGIRPRGARLRRFADPSRPQGLSEALASSTALSAAGKGLTYLRYLAIAFFLGYQLGTDAFFLALGLTALFMLFVDVFDSLGVPALIRARGEDERRATLGSLMVLSAGLAVLMAALNGLLALHLGWLPLGFDREGLAAVARMLGLLTPFIFASFFFQHLGAMFRADRAFHVYFAAELLVSALALVFTLALLLLGWGPDSLAIAVSASTVAGTALLVSLGRRYIVWQWRPGASLRPLLREFAGLAAVYGVMQLLVLVDKVFATYLPPRSVSALTYGLMIAWLPRNVLRFESILVTPIAEHRVHPGRMRVYTLGTVLLAGAVAAFIAITAGDLIALLFGYGALGPADLASTGTATAAYALSLPLVLIWLVYYRAFQVLRRLRNVAVVALAAIALNVAANYFLVFVLGLGIVALPLGTLAAYAVLVLAAGAWLARWKHLEAGGRVLVAGIGALAGYAALALLLAQVRLGPPLLDLAAKGLAFLAALLLAMYLSKVPELSPARLAAALLAARRPPGRAEPADAPLVPASEG